MGIVVCNTRVLFSEGSLTCRIQGPQIYQPKFGPTYRVSFSTSIGLLCCTVLSVATTWFFVIKGDRKRALEEEAMAAGEEQDSGRDGSDVETDEADSAPRKHEATVEKA